MTGNEILQLRRSNESRIVHGRFKHKALLAEKARRRLNLFKKSCEATVK